MPFVSVWMVENSLAESRTEETKRSQKEVERVCCEDWARAGRAAGCLLWKRLRPTASSSRLLGLLPQLSLGCSSFLSFWGGRGNVGSLRLHGGHWCLGFSNLMTPLVTFLCLPPSLFFAEASEIMKSIGEAIQYLHSINIAHRDVKVPAILLGLPHSPPTQVPWRPWGSG